MPVTMTLAPVGVKWLQVDTNRVTVSGMKENITERVHVRTTPSEKKKLEAAVRRHFPYGSFNTWARETLIHAAERLMHDAERLEARRKS